LLQAQIWKSLLQPESSHLTSQGFLKSINWPTLRNQLPTFQSPLGKSSAA